MTLEHRSRRAWPAPVEPAVVPPFHTHRQRRTPLVIAYVGLALLTVAVALLAVYVVRFNDYVQGRGEYRDQENARTNERINDAICELLDQLPPGQVLERPRAKYHCGPGLASPSIP